MGGAFLVKVLGGERDPVELEQVIEELSWAVGDLGDYPAVGGSSVNQPSMIVVWFSN